MSTDVRAAAERLKSAIDRHLEACIDKGGEEDPTVQAAYDALREAAESYDDVLFDSFDEVTPWEFSEAQVYDAMEVEQPGVPARVTVLVRSDFAVHSAADLVEAGRAVLRAADQEEGDPDDAALTAVEALSIYLEVHGLDELAEMADDLGLRWLGGTTWLLDQDVEDDTMRTAPFEAADESRLLHRFFDDVAVD
jgi:hypothetical protein